MSGKNSHKKREEIAIANKMINRIDKQCNNVNKKKNEQSHEVGHSGKLHFVQSIYVSFVQNISRGFGLLKTYLEVLVCSKLKPN